MRAGTYQRRKAIAYAKRWAMGRNPAYYDFTKLGGDCTNFVSQCVYAGAGVMNFTPETGWYYRNVNNRSAAWTGVEYLYRFLIGNSGAGPYAESCSVRDAEPGDVLQLGHADGRFYHCLLVIRGGWNPLIAAHDQDALGKPLSEYYFAEVRALHILGVRQP